MNPNFSDAPSLAVRKRSSANSSGRAFVVESLVLIAFLAVSVAIVLQVFAAAGAISRDAHTLSMSEHLATNAAERFGVNPAESAGVAYYTSSGESLPSDSTATFAVDTSVTQDQTSTGTIYHANIVVTHHPDKDASETTYQLQTDRYLSNGIDAMGTSDASNTPDVAPAEGGES